MQGGRGGTQRSGTPTRKSSRTAQSKSTRPPPPLQQGAKGHQDYFQIGSKLRDRWLLEKRIGDGAFGQVFLVVDQKERISMAIKTEKIDVKRRCLCMEVGVMRGLGKSLNVPYIVACGRTTQCRYIVMELLGKSLWDLRSTYPRKLVPMETVCRIGVQSIQALHDVHAVGFLHRDVKPANFCLGKHPKVDGNVFIFDFGLSRIHLLKPGGKPRKRRRWKPGFRGTVRYASLASHEGIDLGRVDDLIPVYYMLVEMYKGGLPWKRLLDRHQVKECKRNTSPQKLCEEMPKPFAIMGKALDLAKYHSEPKYTKLSGLLDSVLELLGENPKRPIRPGPIKLP